jgi:hydroxypyruvate isomerase
MTQGLRYETNCSMLFTERPLLERPQAAKSAGFDAVEFWWPWPEQPVPSDADVDTFVHAIENAGVELVGLNFFAGDLAGADAGAVSVPHMSAAFRDNVPVTIEIGERLGVRAFNALYGVRVSDATPEQQDELAAENLGIAADAAAGIDATVLLEPVSGPKPYPLRTAADVAVALDRVHKDNVALLADLFHLASNGDDLAAVIQDHADRIGHVQIADVPGRGEPGSGALDIDAYLDQLERTGYDGWIGLEYKPTTTTEETFGWLPRGRRASGARSGGAF